MAMTTNTSLAVTVPFDPARNISGKRKVSLTAEEETAFAAAFVASMEDGFGSIDAGQVGWRMLQERYPRLREFDAAEKSNG
jgi:hypothetical protein